ncbi:MAG TPA: glycosyltransferase family 4 protein [Rhodothermales bacterium]|nr:glycosyltransferase family 4 protein [Rhodothermales bacterium]
MRILFVSQWFPPEPTPISLEIPATLRQFGHEVQVLTGFPNYPSGTVYPGYRIRPWKREEMDGLDVVRVPLYPDHSLSALGRIANYVSFALTSSVLGPFLLKKPDVVLVYHPPLTVALPAWVMSRLRGVPFVYLVQDLWPDTLRATGMVNSERVLALVGRVAKAVYRRAAAVLVISEGFRANLLAKGVAPDKVHVVSNWADADLFAPAEPDRALAEGLAGRFVVMFAGNQGEAQGLDVVLDAADRLRDLPDVEFVLVGEGVATPRLKERAEAMSLPNVRFVDRQPVAAMPGVLALADVLLVHLRADPLFAITIPSKIFAYMASGKPMLAAIEGDGATVVREAGAGLTVPSGDPDALAAAVRAFRAMPAEERARMADNGLRAARTTYSREHCVRQIEAVLQKAAAEA